MKQSVSLITLGVADYARAKAFYEAVGWSQAMDVEETGFFVANGVVLVLWARDKLAADMGVEDDGARWGGIALAHNVGSDAEVDRVVEEARANGAEICRAPAPTFYGGEARAGCGPHRHRLGGAPKPPLPPGRRRAGGPTARGRPAR